MPTTCVSLYTPTPLTTTATTKLSVPNSTSLFSRSTKVNGVSKFIPLRTRASSSSSSSSSSSVTDLDLYDLLGIHNSSDHSQIKNAYRSLQKRCHPDIAGPPGHDMAIILNEAYSVLSDPSSRFAYDKEQAKTAELRGFTGKPIYSVWFGAESEERAVFVDELKCVGCLKCALFAEKTFAIESVYGRARVVAQWADPENKIQEAIGSCPVDCISFVERSDLAALEFLMSKQQRGNVRVGVGNTAGVRVSNIFADVKKFHVRYEEAKGKYSKEANQQREARMSAVQAIRSISNWLYWQTPSSGGSTQSPHHHLTKTNRKSNEPDIGKLRDAASARRKLAGDGSGHLNRGPRKSYLIKENYWAPLTHVLTEEASTTKSSSYSRTGSEASAAKVLNKNDEKDSKYRERKRSNPTTLVIPFGVAMTAAFIVRLNGAETVGGLEDHVGGYLALQIVNSSWLPVILTGITWYVIGILTVGFIQAITSREN